MKKIKLAPNDLCFGCGVCSKVCPTKSIKMINDDLGFSYPLINYNSCVGCGICQQNCAVLQAKMLNRKKSIEHYAAYAKNNDIIQNSTSGGIISLITHMCFNQNYMVFGAALKQNIVQHIECKNMQDIYDIMGSKYVESSINNILPIIKQGIVDHRKILFIGTPCQIAAMKLYTRNYNNLYTIDFLCHGVPSPKIWKEYVKYLENKYTAKLNKYVFRSKNKGWGKINICAEFDSGKKIEQRSNQNIFHLWFGKHYTIRSSCFNCLFRTKERMADITVADFWKINKYYPDFPLKQGVSAVEINTLKGKEFFDVLKLEDKIEYIEVSDESIWEHRKVALYNYTVPEMREEFVDNFKNISFEELIKKYPPKTNYEIIIEKVKSILKIK